MNYRYGTEYNSNHEACFKNIHSHFLHKRYDVVKKQLEANVEDTDGERICHVISPEFFYSAEMI